MAKTSSIEKWKRTPKFRIRKHNRCSVCGRPRGYIARFELCRICFRVMSSRGEIPGIRKASW